MTLQREEIYANDYRNMEHLAARIEEFIERYYNLCRLHSALGYRSPEDQNGDDPQMSLVWSARRSRLSDSQNAMRLP